MKEKKLSLSSSSGSGYNFEHIIETELILDLYYELEYFGNIYFPSSSLDKMIFQGRNLGYKNDDFIIKCNEKTLLFQITEEKISYTSKPSKFSEFIKNAYKDYKKDERVVSILVKSNEIISKDKQIIKFLNNLKVSTFSAYVKTKKSKEEETFLKIVNDILSEYKLSSEDVYNFIKSIYIISKNNSDISNEYKTLIKNNKKNISLEVLTNHIKEFCFKKSINGEEINYIDVFNLLGGYLENKATTFYNLLQTSKRKLNSILDNINDYKIKRDDLVKKFNEGKKDINIIYGSPGVGKSAFIKSIFSDLDYKYKLYMDAEDICSSNYLNELKGFIQNDNLILIIDRCEKLFENDNEAFYDFLKTNKNVNIIFITREYSLYKLKMLLYDSKYDLTKINYLHVDEVESNDVKDVLKANNITLKNNKLLELLKNLFYLNNIVKYSEILKSENELINEFMIKESLFKAITNNNETYKNALLSVFEYKYGINKSNYLKFTKEIEYFIKEEILLENHGIYSFTHDKYDDLVLFYILEGKYHNNLEEILTVKNNLLVLRGLNVWFKDKIHVNKKQMFNEINNILKEGKVLVLFKNEIIKILYTENLIDEFIKNLEISRFFKETSIFNLVISSALIIDPVSVPLFKDKEEIIPNKKYLDIITNIIAPYKMFLNKEHISSLMKILKGICKHLMLDNNLVYTLKDYYTIFTFLLDYYENDYVNLLFKREFLQIYYYFSVYDLSLAEKHLDNIIESKGNERKLNNIEREIYGNLVYLYNRVTINNLYAKKLWERICKIILPEDFFYDDDKNGFNTWKYKSNLNYTTKIPYMASSQLYTVIMATPKKTLDYIDKYITKYVNLYKDKVPSYSIFKFNETLMPLDENHFYAHKRSGNCPRLIKNSLSYVQSYLLNTTLENKKYYLNEMFKNPNSLMKISLMIDIIKTNPKYFFDNLLTICKHKELLMLDLQLTELNKNSAYDKMVESGMIKETRLEEKTNALQKKKLWDILLELQKDDKYKYKIWNLFSKLLKENDETLKKYIYTYDIRNYTNQKETITSDKNSIIKPNKQVKNSNAEFLNTEKKLIQILEGKQKNDYTVTKLKKMYYSIIDLEYLFKNRYLILIVTLITPATRKEKSFQNKARKILISKLSNKNLIVLEKNYRKYILKVINILYDGSRKSRKVIINYLLYIVKKEKYDDENVNTIRNLKASNPKIYEQLLKEIRKNKELNGIKDVINLKLTAPDDLDKHLNEIKLLLEYIKKGKSSDYNYFHIYKGILDILFSNINNKSIRTIIYSYIETNDFHSNIVEELVLNLFVMIERKKINSELFWEVLSTLSTLIWKKIEKGKEEYYIESSTNYFYGDFYLDEAKTIKFLLLKYGIISNDNLKNVLDKKGQKAYLSIAKKFMNLPVGIATFCSFLWRFRDVFDTKELLNFSDIISKSSNNPNYFKDSNVERVLENLLFDIYYKKLDTLTNSELVSLSDIIMNFVIYTSSYKVNYIYQQLLPTIYK